jgi:hypothetical protein
MAEAVTDPAKHVLSDRGVDLYEADWRALAEVAKAAGGVDAVIVDAPYSERTHAGHDEAAASVGDGRRGLDYGSWTADDVRSFCAEWVPQTRGWVVSITDTDLSIPWRDALAEAGLYAFAPMPFVTPGASVRLLGDGPPSWTCWVVVARPRDRGWASWATTEARSARGASPLPGAYVLPSGHGARTSGVVGGKPEWLLRALVRDYTRPGDIVCDPCAGGGTLGVACIAEGRRALLGDRDPAHVSIAADRIRRAPGYQGRLSLDIESKPMKPTVFDFG